jgi:putative DNA methylase
VIDPDATDGWRFEVKSGKLIKGKEERLKTGTKTGRGTHFSCILTGVAINPEYVRDEGLNGRLSARMMAIVCEGKKRTAGHFGKDSEKGEGRVYVSADNSQEIIALSARPADTSGLEVDMPDNPRWFSPPGYGMKRYVDLFTHRQLVALTTFSDLVSVARQRILIDANSGGLKPDETPLHASGTGLTAYADAVVTYLALII